MTRKDFALIADALALARKDARADFATVDIVSERLAWALTDSKPRFDRERFIAACRAEA